MVLYLLSHNVIACVEDADDVNSFSTLAVVIDVGVIAIQKILMTHLCCCCQLIHLCVLLICQCSKNIVIIFHQLLFCYRCCSVVVQGRCYFIGTILLL